MFYKGGKIQFTMLQEIPIILQVLLVTNSIYVHTWKESGESCYENLRNKAWCHVFKTPSKNQNPRKILSGGDGT